MPSVWTQTKGVAKFGPSAGSLVDYASAVTSVDLQFDASDVSIPATLAAGEKGTEPGSKARRLAINYLSESALASLYTEFETAFEGDTPVFFELTLKQGPVSATNPKHTGQIVVDAVSIGGTRAEVRQQQRTYRIKAGTYARAIA